MWLPLISAWIFPEAEREEGGGDRLTGCFEPTPDFSFFRAGLEMGIYVFVGWYFKVTAAPHLKESEAFHCE